MKRILAAFLAAAVLATPAFALDDKQVKKDVATATKAPAAPAKAEPAAAGR